MRKLVLDLSAMRIYVAHNKRISGIQRVLVMVLEELAATHERGQLYLGYFAEESYKLVDVADVDTSRLEDFAYLNQVLDQDCRQIHKTSPPGLQKYQPGTPKYVFHYTRMTINAALGREKSLQRRGTNLQEWRDWFQRPEGALGPTPPTADVSEFDPKTLSVLVMDANWGTPQVEAVFERMAGQGVRINTLVHDLIPLVVPQYTTGEAPPEFARWLLSTTKYTSRYLANSDATAQDLRDFLVKEGADIDVAVTKLAQARLPMRKNAHDPMAKFPMDMAKYPPIERVAGINHGVWRLQGHPYVLCAGTVEIRKNIWRLAQVWKRMVEDRVEGLPKLVVAGKMGWFIDDFMALMNSTGWLGGWVVYVDQPSDADLAFLYRHCEFTTMVSTYEGWGLPIGESLSYGKTAVVSERSSMPEVGLDMVEYCDPYSLDSIEAAFRKLITEPEHRAALEARIADTDLRSWADVAQDMVQAVKEAE